MNLNSFFRGDYPPGLYQVLRIMKLSCLFILMLLTQLNAKTYSQNVSIQKRNSTFPEIFREISGQTGYHFFYNRDEVLKQGKVNITLHSLPLEEAISQCLKGTNMDYKIFNRTVVIKVAVPGGLTTVPQTVADAVITGKVTDETGKPLPGAAVKTKSGAASTVTDEKGNFKLVVNHTQETLVITYVGYITKEIALAGRSEIEIRLLLNNELLNEVVVTSFGITRNKESTSYAVQKVNEQAIQASKQYNIGNALQGKVAGLQITSSSGTPGASADIILRGGTSLDGNNQPLFVIDGIPVDNTTIAEPQGSSGQLARTVSNSNRAVDINPDDIESVTVLKGPAAAALYGLKAAAGAIIITTKKGISGQGKITFNNDFELQEQNQLPDFQNVYKMGTGGQDVNSRLSWGPLFGENATLYDNAENFFQTGRIWTNNLSFSGGTDKATFYASAANTDQKGIVPQTGFKKKSFRLNSDLNVIDKLKVGFTSNYIHTLSQQALQGPGVNNGSGGVFGSIAYWPLSDDMKNYLNADGTRRRLVSNINEDIDNPYWSVHNNPVSSGLDRFIGTGQVKYEPLSWLDFTYRIGIDFYRENYQSLRSPGTSLNQNSNGGLLESEYFNKILTSTFLANAHTRIGKSTSLTLLIGQNFELNNYTNNTVFGTNFLNPGFVSMNNTANKFNTQYLADKKLIGVFGNLQLDYKSIFFLDVTGRNDWSSTLPAQNRSFFYPSIGGGAIFSKLLKLKSAIFSYGKVRATYAKVGKDAPPNKLQTQLTTDPGIVLGNGFGYGFYANNSFLRPEYTNSLEIGTELGFFSNRLNLDITYYRIESKDQITQPRVSQGTGFIFKLINGGTILNKGFELSLNAVPVSQNNFKWTADLNWSTNKATVTELPLGTSVFRNSNAIAVFNLAEGSSFLNGNFYGIRGTTYTKNENGQVIIGENGYPTVNTSQQVDLGVSRQPDWIAGLTNSFTYKNLNLSFLIDVRKGGTIFNGTEYELVKSGLSNKTLNRNQLVVLPGVTKNPDGSYTPNTKQVLLDQTYYTTIYAANAENFLEDGTWYRLRYLSLSYTLPQKLLKQTPIKKLSLNVTGKNLVLITNYSGFDPELSAGGAGVGGTGTVGIDYLGFPSTRGFSFGLNATF